MKKFFSMLHTFLLIFSIALATLPIIWSIVAAIRALLIFFISWPFIVIHTVVSLVTLRGFYKKRLWGLGFWIVYGFLFSGVTYGTLAKLYRPLDNPWIGPSVVYLILLLYVADFIYLIKNRS